MIQKPLEINSDNTKLISGGFYLISATSSISFDTD